MTRAEATAMLAEIERRLAARLVVVREVIDATGRPLGRIVRTEKETQP
jgi:hypothetical protein